MPGLEPNDIELRRSAIKRKLELKTVSLINSGYKLQEIVKNINCFSEEDYLKSLVEFRKELSRYVEEYDQFYKVYFASRNNSNRV